jgi:hypothetical protein
MIVARNSVTKFKNVGFYELLLSRPMKTTGKNLTILLEKELLVLIEMIKVLTGAIKLLTDEKDISDYIKNMAKS